MLIGLGAMGVFFAPRLGERLGDQFKVIAGGERRKKLETQGVIVNGVKYAFNLIDPEVRGQEADLIIMAVKDMQLISALEDIRHFVGAKTQILCVMNGIESEETVAKYYGWDHVLYSYMRVSIVMKDQTADFDPNWGFVHFGEADNRVYSKRVKAVKKLFDEAGIPSKVEKDMKRGIWFKYMCNIGENMTCALLGVPFGAFHRSEHANAIRRQAMREVIAIAQAKGISLSEEDMEKQEETILKIPFRNKPSTLQDLEGTKQTEIEMFSGSLVRMGEELGIDTPINFMFYHGIHVLQEKNKGMFLDE